MKKHCPTLQKYSETTYWTIPNTDSSTFLKGETILSLLRIILLPKRSHLIPFLFIQGLSEEMEINLQL